MNRPLLPLLFVLFALMLPIISEAAVSITAHPNPVLVGEVFELTITQSPAGRDEPRLLALPQGLRELQRQSSQSTQIINGKTRTSRSWRIAMVATQGGDFAIPFSDLDGEPIQPTHVHVRTPDPHATQRPEVFAEFTASTTDSWVGAEISLHLRIYVTGELDSGSLPHPSAPGLVIENLSESNDGEKLIGNTRYRVLERRYVAFAESAGAHTIPGPVFTGQVIDRSRRSRFPTFSIPTRHISAVAPDITLRIKEAEPNPSGAWLPASHVEIEDELEIPGGEAETGQALTRTVTLVVDGLLHTQLPELNWPLPPRDAAQSFAEEAQSNTQPRITSSHHAGVRTVRIQRFVHIPQAATLELPAVHLPWFNTQTGHWEQAQLPARRISVKTGNSAEQPPAQENAAQAHLNKDGAAGDAIQAAPTTRTPTPYDAGAIDPEIWKITTAISSLGWIVTLIFWLASRRRTLVASKAQPAPMSTATVSERRKCAIRAANGDNAAETAHALLSWARANKLFEEQDTPGLLQLARRLGDGRLSEEIRRLSDCLYGECEWSGQVLAKELKSYKPPKPKTGKHHAPKALAPLYPED